MDIKKVLISNYLPYAKGVIVGRAIPSIDGLKPSQRRILYTMYKMGLINGGKSKSSNIVGQSMRYHPHGDASLYDTLVRLSTGYDGLNAPYVESKGNFGKVYSDELAYAAPRYTEAKLTQICKEVFEGIDEDAVELIDNFDNTMKEPTLLPVKFPSILVNPSNGIAVGLSSSIPSFSLKNTCNATIGILKGEVDSAEKLMELLGVPEFTTGGHVHSSPELLKKLGETGKATFDMSGSVSIYRDRIVIHEIPYKVKSEQIISAIENNMKAGNLKEVADVIDETDINGFKLVVMLKARANASDVLKKLRVMTPITSKISFNTRVIINNRCEELGIFELLNRWIEFREACIVRIYNHRLGIASKKEHTLEAWEKLKLDIREVAKLIASKTEAEARKALMEHYKLDNEQADYILDMKIKMFTEDNLAKKLKELSDTRDNIKRYNEILGDEQQVFKIMISELEGIRDKYGNKDNKTQSAPMLEEVLPKEEKKEAEPDKTPVRVIITKSGYVRRLSSIRDMANYVLPSGEEEEKSFSTRNCEDLLVFCYDGSVHKIPIDTIDTNSRTLKDEVYKLAGLKDKSGILYIDTSGDYNKHFNLVYSNGRGTRVDYSKFSGKRKVYKSLFEAGEKGTLWITPEDTFFMITAKRKAAYANLELMGMFGSRVAFKVARVSSGDRIVALYPAKFVPDISRIDLNKYSKGYTVKIGDDVLWKK